MKFGIGPAIAGKLTSQVAMVAILATATVGGVSIISSSVFASLDATATYSPQTIDNGTLLLTATDATSPLSGGFTAAIDLLAPADIVHRYVTVVNTGTIAGLGLTLSGTPTSPTTLDGDINVTAQACTVAWTISGNTSTCSGVGAVASPAATGLLSAFSSAQSLGVSLGTTLGTKTTYVKITVSLVDIVETSNNGSLIALTHEGKTTSVTWQFAEAQRAATETNS